MPIRGTSFSTRVDSAQRRARPDACYDGGHGQNERATGIKEFAVGDPEGKTVDRRWLNLVVAPSQETVTICLLDDDSSVLKSSRRLLNSVGHTVESFTDPHAFLEHAARHRPDVAVIDVWMPAMHGLEVQAQLRAVSPSTSTLR